MMKKLILFLFPLLLVFAGVLFAETNTETNKVSNTPASTLINDQVTPPQWEMKQLSKDKHFNVKLVCSSAPSVGSFQDCQLHIDTLKKAPKEGKKHPLKNATIVLEGGMPAHQHGLPTSPVVSWLATDNHYQIKGLKFSMPGDWFLRFHIKNSDSSLVDQVEFDFSI